MEIRIFGLENIFFAIAKKKKKISELGKKF